MSDPETSSPSGGVNGKSGTAPTSGGDPTAIPTSGGPPPNIQKLVASKRLQQAQAQVGEVVDIMRVNVEKVLERDQKISELDRRADDLQEGASQFQQHAVKLKRKYWWENIKMWIIIGIILLAVVIIVVVTTTAKDGNITKVNAEDQTVAPSTTISSEKTNEAPPVKPIPGGGETVPSDFAGGFKAG